LFRRSLEFGGKTTQVAKAQRRVRAFFKNPKGALKSYCWTVLRKVPPLGYENYGWHWNYLSFSEKTVLDLGADYGSTADYFLRHGANAVIAVDGNKVYADKFRQLLGNNKRIVYVNKWIGSGTDIDLLIAEFSPDIVKVDIEGNEKLLLDVNVGRVKEWLVETHTEQLYQVISKFFVHNGFKVSTVEYGKTLGAPQIKVLIAKALP
jgi:hypothetical protein